MTEKLRAYRQSLNDREAMAEAQAGCVPCKLCGGKAVITDAGVGAGYYIACQNSGAFRASQGCMITERRLGGWAYNVMDWWNRLHSVPTPAADEVEAAFREGHQRGRFETMHDEDTSWLQSRALAAMQVRSAEPAQDRHELPATMQTADRLARRMGGRFVPHAAEPAGVEPVAWMYVYTVQYAPKMECTAPLKPVVALSATRWDKVPKHWTETPLYARPATPTNPERLVEALRRCEETIRRLNVSNSLDGLPGIVAIADVLKDVGAALSAAPLKEGSE